MEQELEDISSRKQEALYIFENETSPRLGEEIRQNNAARLQELKTRLQQTTESRKERELQLKTVVINLTDNYEAYIGKEFMTQENLELLIQIFENGEASNMTEAQAVFRTRRP